MRTINMDRKGFSLLVAGLALIVALAPGCADEQPPRNTVQHGVIAKDDLLGKDGKAVWHYMQTVVDVPYATGFTFTGEQPPRLEKIRWDIQEKVLYARRAYEWIRGSDSASSSAEQGTDPKKVVGAPVAAFAIEKHFDIIRDYNSATGEEINKIVENAEDRHWYQRRFLRVDWSKNLINNFEFLVHYDDEGVAPLRQEAVPYYVSDPDDPDALRVRRPLKSDADQNPTADYLEATTKLMVTPEMTNLYYTDGTYRLPACYMAEDYGPEYTSSDCSAQEVKLRHSFSRVGKRDYDSLVYDDRWMERFGYFSTERQSFDKQYAETEAGRVRLANRFNIWNKSMSKTACSLKEHYKAGADAAKARAAARAAADKGCRAKEGAGSRCSLMQGSCTLDPSKRGGVRKIVYYLNVGFPSELVSTAKATLTAWNDAFQTTAARMRFASDSPTDGSLLAKRKKELGTIFEVRENGCSEANVNAFLKRLPELAARVSKATGEAGPAFKLSGKALVRACSALEQATAYGQKADERFTWQRIGDLRYSMLYWVGIPTRMALLGYGPSSIDPETGEIVQATAFVYGSVLDLYAARAADIVGLLNCKDSACVQKFAKGVPMADWVALAKSGPSKGKTFSKAQVQKMAGRMQLDWLEATTAKLPKLDWRTLETLRKSYRKRAAAMAATKVLGQNGKSAEVRLKAIKGTALEAMARKQFMQSIGLSSSNSATGKAAARLPLYHWAGPGMLKARRKAKRHLAKRRVELAEFFDNLVLGLAQRYKDSKKTRPQIYADLRARLLRATAEHEVGHTIGLRHNFAGSYDALNYNTSYWKLRVLDAKGGALPRYKFAYTKNELNGNPKDPTTREGLGVFQYSSIMDYGARFNSDLSGLGFHDIAAIKFGYGQIVEVFNKTSTNKDDKYLLANTQTSIRWGEPMLYTISCDGKNYRSVHYTEYPRLLGGRGNMGRENRVDVPLHRMTTKKLSKIAPGCAVYKWGGLWDSDVPVDDKGRFEVPFRFCSDEFESASPECSAFDAGADMYELTRNLMDGYHNYYLFNNLKLDRLGFSLWGYLDNIDYRYFEPLRSSMQFYLLTRGYLTDDPRNASYLGDSELKAFFTADNGYGPWTVAVDQSLNFLLGVLATPEVGKYWLGNDDRYDQISYVDSTGNPLPADLSLSVPTGKYLESEWDFDSGYYWFDKMTHVGIFHDKYLALWALTNPDTYFLGRDSSADLRQYAINYYRLYPDIITKQMRGIFTEDWSITAHYASNKKLARRDYTTATPPKGSYPVNPQMGYSVQFFAGLLGVGLIPWTFDTSFTDSCRVWVKGGSEAITPTKTPVCFNDPFSNKSYCAMDQTKNGKQAGIGAAMIAQANALANTYQTSKKATDKLALLQYIDSLDLMRSITAYYAYTPF